MYPFLFQAASCCHVQDVETDLTTSQCVPHTDKAGLITAIYQVQGISYNFVAVQDPASEVQFETDDDDYIRYEHYKEQLNKKERKKIIEFEKDIFKAGKEKAYTKIIVKQLLQGHYMVFAAALYHHFVTINYPFSLFFLSIPLYHLAWTRVYDIDPFVSAVQRVILVP